MFLVKWFMTILPKHALLEMSLWDLITSLIMYLFWLNQKLKLVPDQRSRGNLIILWLLAWGECGGGHVRVTITTSRNYICNLWYHSNSDKNKICLLIGYSITNLFKLRSLQVKHFLTHPKILFHLHLVVNGRIVLP